MSTSRPASHYNLSRNNSQTDLNAVVLPNAAYPPVIDPHDVRDHTVKGLGRPLPTAEELAAAEQIKHDQHHRPANAPQYIDHASLPTDNGNIRYVLVTPESMRALQAGGSLSQQVTRQVSRAPTLIPAEKPGQAHLEDRSDEISLTRDEEFPNRWAAYRQPLRECAAEFFGTAIILLFGNGVNQQYFLSLDTNVSGIPRGTYLSVSFCWGIGVMMGVYVAGGISGAHLNPAVTISLATFRGFPWKKVIPYIVAQFLGAMSGSGLVSAIYSRATSIYEGGPNIRTFTGAHATGPLYVTTPLAYMGPAQSFFNEFLDSAILLFVILAIGDRSNTPPPDGMNPFVLLWLITGIGAALGSQTAYAINPARDWGPRFALWMRGYGTEIWTAHDYYALYVPLVAPVFGALAGALLYDVFLYTGADSPINKPTRWGKQRREQAAAIRANSDTGKSVEA